EKVAVDGKTYDIALQFKRMYKPYAVRLITTNRENYPGTDTPQSYFSDIRLIDARTDDDRRPHISMNNPLRYAGETFYQSGFALLPSGIKITTLSVVKNVGWMIPYVGCMIVAVGL